MADTQQSMTVQLTFQEVSVLLALLDVLAAEDQSADVVRLAFESQTLLRQRALAAMEADS